MSATDLEQRLGASLQTRAAAVHGAPLTLDGVRRRATSIRRRRRAATGAGVLAAAAVLAAVAIPTAALWRGSAPIAPAESPGRADAWLHDRVVTRPDGSTVTVPFDTTDTSTFGVLTDGRVVGAVSKPDGSARVVVVREDGTVDAEYPAEINVLTMGQGDRTAAWVGSDRRVRVLESGTREPVTMAELSMPGESFGMVLAVLGADCAEGGCRVLAGDHSTTLEMTGPEPARPLDLPEPFRVSDVTADGSLWAVDLEPARNEQHGCAALYDPTQGAITARSCDTSSLEFSPDGEHVLGARGDNNMWSEVTVLDLDLREVASYVPGREEALSRVGWAGATDVFIVRGGWDGTDWRMERVDIHTGDTVTVTGPVDGPNPEMSSDVELSD